MKTIIFTGGGTAGHVTPNLALIERLDKSQWSIHYIGTKDSIEQRLIESAGIDFHCISSGKVRRYFSLKNLTDPFRVLKGIIQSRRLIKKLKPAVVFSKGGFVSVPVVIAAKGLCPVIAHESDYTPGLANRIAARYATTVCVTFKDTQKYVKGNKAVHTGTPIRSELFLGNRQRALEYTKLTGDKPVVLIMGGSQGAQRVNELVRESLDLLLDRFSIIHLCGEGKVDENINKSGYIQYSYVSKEMGDLLALADVVVSRAGSNSIFELLALNKPSVLIPLPLSASRGDQILNAKYFEKLGYATRLDQDNITHKELAQSIIATYENRHSFIESMAQDKLSNGTDAIIKLICEAAEG